MKTVQEQYGVRIPDREIRRRMREQSKPYHDEAVLEYLHFELEMSSREIAELFGVARQTIQKIVRGFDWEFNRSRGDNRLVDENQQLLADYEPTTLDDLF